MTATRTPRPAKVSPRAFTLLEAATVLAIIGILSVIAAVGYNGVRRGQLDSAGQPILGAALVDGRMVAAVSGQIFPDAGALLPALNGRASSVNGANVTYTDQGSRKYNDNDIAPVAVAVGNPNTVGYAVATSIGAGMYTPSGGDASDVNCAFAVDSLVDGTTYAKTTLVTAADAAPGCKPILVVACSDAERAALAGDGTAESPYILPTMPPASCPSTPLEPLDGPLCVAAQPEDAAPGLGTSSAMLSWVPSTTASQTTSYTAVVSPPVTPAIPPIDSMTRHILVGNLVAGNTYTVNLFAVNGTGNQFGPTASNTFVAAPAGPPSLVATPTAVGSVAHVRLTWSPAPGATSYTLTRTPAFAAAPPAQSVLSFDDSTVSSDATYSYTVTANPPAVSPTPIRCGLPISTPAGGSTTVATVTLPVSPVLHGLVSGSTNSLDWTAAPSATSYRLYSCSSLPCLPSGVPLYNDTSLIYDHTGRAWGSPPRRP